MHLLAAPALNAKLSSSGSPTAGSQLHTHEPGYCHYVLPKTQDFRFPLTVPPGPKAQNHFREGGESSFHSALFG